MKLSLEKNDIKYQITTYVPNNNLIINEKIYTHSVLISPNKLQRWQPQLFKELKNEHFTEIKKLQPEAIIFGSGAELQFPELYLYADLINNNIGVEIMNTAAACRTYSIVAAEERNIVIALLL
jgi:uncharacterized protein